MIWRVEIVTRKGISDAYAEGIKKDIYDLGFYSVNDVRVVQVYSINGDIDQIQIERVAKELLADSVTQDAVYYDADQYCLPSRHNGTHVIEIAYRCGVTDPVEESTIKGIRDLGIANIHSVHTARQYHITGALNDSQLHFIVEKVLANKLIQHIVKHYPDPHEISVARDRSTAVVTVDLINAGNRQLCQLSRAGQLFLNLQEMQTIRQYFRRLNRNPTDCELETIAQTWSEHCYHKTFKGHIHYCWREDGRLKKRKIYNLLKSTIMKATRKINKSWCVSVFHDNAGVIQFDRDYHLCFKVETHNHPSALEPFGGANTGIGGVIRDTLGTGLGAKPVCNTDIFCFAPPDYSFDRLPAGTLHPKRVMKGVVSGVRDYGNKMGIPTVNGAILFDDLYVGNPLVFCGNIGLLPKGKENKKVSPGDLIVVAGGHTGRDGIHGATFSSGELTSESEAVSSGAVQIGDPIQEKKILDVLMQARDRNLYSAITDCGAGGLSSAVGEMGEGTGARVDLEKVPLKYQGMNYMEIWISESQERMVLSVPPKHITDLLDLFAAENVEATVIGEFTSNGRLELSYHGTGVCDLDMHFLHKGIGTITKEAHWFRPRIKEPRFQCPVNLNQSLLDVLAHYNVCSKEWVIRQYDHEVQGGSVIKPLVGPGCDGPSDAAVVAPRLGSSKGFAVSNGINPRYGMIDPFWMAAACIDEAIRQIIAVGGTLDKIALLDNFCWGNPDKPDRLGSLVRASLGCYKTAVAYGVPFISGKDSLYNQYTLGKRTISIPDTLLISAVGIIDDITRCVSMDFKRTGNLIYLIGMTKAEMGGSVYYDCSHALGVTVPKVDAKQGIKVFGALSQAIRKGTVRSVHDCSDGGLAVALSEMAFGGRLGAEISLSCVPYKGKEKRDDVLLFSETPGRFVAEVEPAQRRSFMKIMCNIPMAEIGRTAAQSVLTIVGLDGQVCVNADIATLREAWQRPLRW